MEEAALDRRAACHSLSPAHTACRRIDRLRPEAHHAVARAGVEESDASEDDDDAQRTSQRTSRHVRRRRIG
jgi:hypothetical protein